MRNSEWICSTARRSNPISRRLRPCSRAYEADFPQAEWLWKYFACPHGKCSVVAESDGRVVAHYGGWRTRLRGSAGTVEAAVLCDTMTDPSIRVSGRTPVLQRLHEAFLGLCRKRGVQFCYGFPNLAAARFGSRFLGYELLGPLLFLRRPVSAGAERPACAVRIGDVFPEEHDRLAAKLHAQPGWRADPESCGPELAIPRPPHRLLSGRTRRAGLR